MRRYRIAASGPLSVVLLDGKKLYQCADADRIRWCMYFIRVYETVLTGTPLP